MSNIVALIPARGGSMRIPGKNLRVVGGMTLLARTVQFALKHPKFSMVIVSSDSEEIRHEACQHGAEAHYRSRRTSRDDTPMSTVVRQFLQAWELIYPKLDIVIVLQPNVLPRLPGNIDRVIGAVENGADSALTVADGKPTGEVYGASRNLILSGRLLGPTCRDIPTENIPINIDTEYDLVRAERWARSIS